MKNLNVKSLEDYNFPVTEACYLRHMEAVIRFNSTPWGEDEWSVEMAEYHLKLAQVCATRGSLNWREYLILIREGRI